MLICSEMTYSGARKGRSTSRGLKFRSQPWLTHIIQRSLNIFGHPDIVCRKLPACRIPIRTEKRNNQTQPRNLPISLKRSGMNTPRLSRTIVMTLTAALTTTASGVKFEWTSRAEVCKNESPLHSCRIPFWIYVQIIQAWKSFNRHIFIPQFRPIRHLTGMRLRE